MNRLWPWLVALLLFLGVGFFVAQNQWEVAFRNAQAARDGCYAARGFQNRTVEAVRIPPAVVEECTQPMRRYDEATAPWLIGGGAGAIAALIALAVIFGLRRAMRSNVHPSGG